MSPEPLREKGAAMAGPENNPPRQEANPRPAQRPNQEWARADLWDRGHFNTHNAQHKKLHCDVRLVVAKHCAQSGH